MRVKKRLVVAACLCMLCGITVLADIVLYSFTGQVEAVGGNAFGLGVSIGDPITGTFGYETTTTATDGNSFLAFYEDAVTNFTVNINGNTIAADLPDYQVTVENAPGIPTEDVFGLRGPRVGEPQGQVLVNGGLMNGTLELKLEDSGQTVFSNTSLPTTLNLADFDSYANPGYNGNIFSKNGSLGLVSTGNGAPFNAPGFYYSVSSLQAIPEPSSLAMFGAVTLCVGGALWLRRRE